MIVGLKMINFMKLQEILVIIHIRVIARKSGTISCHNQSDEVAIGHSFWKIKLMYLKFLLEMANLEVIRLPIFQKN